MDGQGSTMWIFGLCLLSFISFWCQSVVTEERLVPALNVISDYYNIPDDIAGATLMASGASSPELLCTLVSLFITHSSLGLGTIVGSEIFNLLIICAGSVYASKVHEVPHEKYGSRYLVLDKVMVVREALFYGLSIALLYVALGESGVVVVQDEENGGGEIEEERIIVSFWKSFLVFGLYVVYVIFCANMSRIMSMLNATQRIFGFGVVTDEVHDNHQTLERGVDERNVATPSSVHYMSFDEGELRELPYLYNVTTEPIENYVHIEGSRTHSTDDAESQAGDDHNVHITMGEGSEKRSYLAKAFKLIKPNHLLTRDEYPPEINEVFELNSGSNNEIGCFLWQRSVFYSKAFFGSHAFHLRWFTITPKRISSSPDRLEPMKHEIVYPLFDEIHVDANRLIINIVHPVKGKHNFTLMAPSKAIFEAVLNSFQVYMETNESLRAQGVLELEEELGATDADEHVTLIERPTNATLVETILWYSVLPLRYAMHYTLPDVRHLDHHGEIMTSIRYAYLSTITCLIWLILGSYAMVTSLESLADQIGISNEVMGVTLSAAGTSLPAYIASRIAAERGFGNQAVANVFGSNTFNIAIGLGLPWAIYIAANEFEPYQDLANEGILESMIVLAGTLILFVVLMVSSGFVLQKWHADMFVLLYVVYILYAILS